MDNHTGMDDETEMLQELFVLYDYCQWIDEMKILSLELELRPTRITGYKDE